MPLIIIAMLMTGLVFTSTAAFAYWQEVSRVSNVVIEFNETNAELQVVPVHDSFTGMLVPTGYVYLEGEVDQVEFEYEVNVTETLVQSMNLIVEAIDVNIGGLEDYEHLVDIQIGSGNRYVVDELFNDKVTVRVIVKLTEPIDEQEAIERGLPLERVNVLDSEQAYEAIKGETISFTLRFRIEPKNQ